MNNNSSSSKWNTCYPNQCGVHINDLPDSCLDHIFAKLPLKDKFRAVPYICKRWKRIADESGTMWSKFQLDDVARNCHLDSPATRAAAVAWFKKHGHNIKELWLNDLWRDIHIDAWVDLFSYMMPYSAASLHTIDIGNIRIPDSLISSLAWCTQLQSLALWVCLDDYKEIWERNKLHALSLLPRLTSVTFGTKDPELATRNPGFLPVLLSMTQLRELSIGAVTWSEDFSGLSNLQSLTLTDMTQPIPRNITELSKLQRLQIDCNLVSLNGNTLFPPCISKLQALEHLELGYFMKGNFDHAGSLTTLTSLTLYGCKLSEFPSFISKLCKLKVLKLRANAIAVIPDWIVGLPCLQEIDLVYNALDTFTLPKCVTQLTTLTTLLFNDLCPLGCPCRRLIVDNGTNSSGHRFQIVWDRKKSTNREELWVYHDGIEAVISYLKPRFNLY